MRILSFIAPLQNLPAYLHLTPAPCHLLCLGRSVHALSGPPPDSWTRIYLFYLFNDLPPIFPSISCINFSPQDHYQMHMKVLSYLPHFKQTLPQPHVTPRQLYHHFTAT